MSPKAHQTKMSPLRQGIGQTCVGTGDFFTIPLDSIRVGNVPSRFLSSTPGGKPGENRFARRNPETKLCCTPVFARAILIWCGNGVNP